MKPLLFESTQDTPSVVLNKDTNTYIIAERSYPEDAHEFYYPILKWINEYIKQPTENTIFDFKLDYFNTISSKQLFKIMLMLEELSKLKPVTIRWHFRSTDREMKTHGEIFSKIITARFEMVEF